MTSSREGPGYTRQLLEEVASESKSLVDMLRRLEQPMGSGPARYLRRRLAHYAIDISHFVEEPLPRRPRRNYTPEELAEAASRSHSVREVMNHLGVQPYDSAYRHLAQRLARLGIDTSHFAAGISEERLRNAVAASASIAETIRALGLAESGSARALVKAGIESYGLSTAHFTGQAHGRNRPPWNRKTAEELLQRLPDGAPRAGRALLHRALQEKGVPYRCDECGLGELWRGKRLVLEIDHLNGDRLDNRINNLRYLCPSCHSQTPAFSRSRRSPALPHQREGGAQ